LAWWIFCRGYEGVMLDVFPNGIVDITHAIQATMSRRSAGDFRIYRYFQRIGAYGLVDRGGSERRPILATVGEHYLWRLTMACFRWYTLSGECAVREITSSHYFGSR